MKKGKITIYPSEMWFKAPERETNLKYTVNVVEILYQDALRCLFIIKKGSARAIRAFYLL